MDDGEHGSEPTEPQRLRRAGTIVGLAALLGVGAGVVSAIGGGGSVGIVLLLTAAGCLVAAVDGGVLMLVDQYRGRTSTWRRLVLVLGLLLATTILLAMVGGTTARSS